MKMIHLLSPLLFLLLLSFSKASELELRTVYLPLYIDHAVVNEGEEAVHAKPRPIRIVSRGAEPETTLFFLRGPYIPRHDTSWSEKKDSNLISVCGIKITYNRRKRDSGEFATEIRLDASSFSKPENVQISDEEAMDLVRQAITLNFPQASVVIKTEK